MNDKTNYTYTLNINPVEYRGVLYNTITLPVGSEYVIEKKLEAMNGVYEDANKVLRRFTNERKD